VHHGPLTFEATLNRRKKGIPTGSYGTLLGDTANRGTDERDYARLNYRSNVGMETTYDASFAFDRYRYEGRYLFPGADWGLSEPTALIRDWADAKELSAELQGTWILAGQHTLISGIEARETLRQAQGNEVIAPRSINFRKAASSSIYSPYAQFEWRAQSNLIVNVGLRHDHYRTFGGTTNPRLGVIFLARPGTSLKAIAGTAFRAPNVYEYYYTNGSTIFKPSNRLEPEKITTFEIAAEHRLNEWTELTTSVFRYDLSDLITQTIDPADGGLIFKNRNRARTTGIEGEIALRLSGESRLTANLSYQQVDDPRTGVRLNHSPQTLAKVRYQAPGWKGNLLKAAVEARYLSARSNVRGQNVGGSWLADLTLRTGEVAPNLRATLKVQNLFDAAVSDPAPSEIAYPAVPLPGRTFRLTLDYRY